MDFQRPEPGIRLPEGGCPRLLPLPAEHGAGNQHPRHGGLLVPCDAGGKPGGCDDMDGRLFPGGRLPPGQRPIRSLCPLDPARGAAWGFWGQRPFSSCCCGRPGGKAGRRQGRKLGAVLGLCLYLAAATSVQRWFVYQIYGEPWLLRPFCALAGGPAAPGAAAALDQDRLLRPWPMLAAPRPAARPS